jgi:hypothetical protein
MKSLIKEYGREKRLGYTSLECRSSGDFRGGENANIRAKRKVAGLGKHASSHAKIRSSNIQELGM